MQPQRVAGTGIQPRSAGLSETIDKAAIASAPSVGSGLLIWPDFILAPVLRFLGTDQGVRQP